MSGGQVWLSCTTPCGGENASWSCVLQGLAFISLKEQISLLDPELVSVPSNLSSFLCPWSPRESRIAKEIDRGGIMGVVELRKLIVLVTGLSHQDPAVVSAGRGTGMSGFTFI